MSSGNANESAGGGGGEGGAALTNDQLEDLRDVFTVFDRDGDGFITGKEIGDVMRALGQSATEAEIQDMMLEVDLDGSGSIDFAEFCVLMDRRMRDEDTELERREIFCLIDRNSDGYVTPEELRPLLANLGERVTDEHLMEIVRAGDKNGDGKLDYREFCDLIKSHTEQRRKESRARLMSSCAQPQMAPMPPPPVVQVEDAAGNIVAVASAEEQMPSDTASHT